VNLAVVKLGGSAATRPVFDAWLAALSRARQPLVVVPGGGPFADQVRSLQVELGFSDRTAHRMALLAMEQYGLAIAERGGRRFEAVSGVRDFEWLLSSGRLPVWLPSALALAVPSIPQDWTVTSDSLAVWLAAQLGAYSVLLIKQTDDFTARDTPATLSARGIVDPGVPAMLRSGVELRLAGPRSLNGAASRLAAGRLPGVAIAETGERRSA
jgi:aspartokinase-like uncharacterized kinase